MNTLSNVHIQRGGANPRNVRLTSDVFPKEKKIQVGVSVRYAYDSSKQWYVLRVTYNRLNKACDFIANDNTDIYVPMHFVQKIIKGRKKRVKKPLLPNLLFVYSTYETVDKYVKETPELPFINYYYNHFVVGNDGKNPPLVINYNEMMNFIKATSVENEHVMIVEPQKCHYKSGDKVRIVAGDFQGIEGKVARVAGQQRVIVTIEGLCSVATAYIPSAFLEKIE